MPKAILYRNDDRNGKTKAAIVYRNMELALQKIAQADGRDLRPNFDPHALRTPRKGTIYTSPHSVVAIGVTAHERLANVVRTSLIYLDPQPSRVSDGPDVAKLISTVGAGQTTARVSLLGHRARQASVFLPVAGSRIHDLPPMDLFSPRPREGEAPRLTIVNHLAHDRLARRIVGRFLDNSSFAIDCFGLGGEPHNRVRYLHDDEVGDITSSVHIHIGSSHGRSERLRICDSWQSRIPVLVFNHTDDGSRGCLPPDLHDESNVLACDSYGQACEFLALLLDTPNLYRQLAESGRASAAAAARSWDGLAQELAA